MLPVIFFFDRIINCYNKWFVKKHSHWCVLSSKLKGFRLAKKLLYIIKQASILKNCGIRTEASYHLFAKLNKYEESFARICYSKKVISNSACHNKHLLRCFQNVVNGLKLFWINSRFPQNFENIKVCSIARTCTKWRSSHCIF